jgi:hypothetical protein
MEKFDFKSLLTKRNIIVSALAICLIVALSLTLVFCDFYIFIEAPDSGEQTPDGDNGGDKDGTVNGGEIDLGGGSGNNDPEKPEEPEKPEDPEDPEDPSIPDWRNDPLSLTYEYYKDVMTPDERKEHYDLCKANGIDYYDWYNAAKKAYDDANKTPEIDGDIDLGGGN